MSRSVGEFSSFSLFFSCAAIASLRKLPYAATERLRLIHNSAPSGKKKGVGAGLSVTHSEDELERVPAFLLLEGYR